MLKNVLKKTWLYDKYSIIQRDYLNNNKRLDFGTISLKPIRSLDTDSIIRLLKRIAVPESTTAFQYFIDERYRVPGKYCVIDNMPVDYSRVLNIEHFCIGWNDEKMLSSVEAYAKRNGILDIYKTPQNLKEALQRILFWNQLLWQTGHRLNGLGRLDKVLEPFPTDNDSKELIKEFLSTLHKYYRFKSNQLQGDTGQIIILGGDEADGSYFCNDYTYLFIDCIKELALPDPKLLLRVSERTPEVLIKKAVECISTGVGSPILSNDEVVVSCLKDFGYKELDALNYGVSACWEPLSIGNSLEQNNIACINYGMAIHKAIVDERFLQSGDIGAIKELLFDYIEVDIKNILNEIHRITWEKDPLLSMILGLEKDISEGGTTYNNYGILSVGMSSLVDSIINLQKYVFEKKKYTLEEIKEMITDNYSNYDEELSLFSASKVYGSDDSEAILLTNEVIAFTEKCLNDYRNIYGGKVKFGLSSPSYVTLGKRTPATLDGRKDGEPFTTHISNDSVSSPTEIINFASKLKFSGISCNANVVDIMITPSLISDNKTKFIQLIRGAIVSGFFQMQFNVLSYAQLVDAKAHPEKYSDLIVRVWGFSAYFNDLPEEYKDLLIHRAKEMEHIA